MKRNFKVSGLLCCVLFLLLFVAAPVAASEQITVVGTVNSVYQIVTEDQQTYDIAENEKGDEVVEMIGRKVKVTGTVEEQEDTKVILVTSYEIIEE